MSDNLLFLEEIDHLILSSDKLFLNVKFNRLEITCKSCSSNALHYRLILGFFIATITFFFFRLRFNAYFPGKETSGVQLMGYITPSELHWRYYDSRSTSSARCLYSQYCSRSSSSNNNIYVHTSHMAGP